MKTVKGYHGEFNMGSPGGWEYQRIGQFLGKKAWDLIGENIEVGIELDFDHPQINAVPGFARMILRAHQKQHGKNPVRFVFLAETETLDVVLENKNFVDYLNTMEGVTASLAGPGHLSLKNGKVYCTGEEATVIFMDFNLDTLLKIGQQENIDPIKEAIKQNILVNPKGMEPLGAKGMFEAITGRFKDLMSASALEHTPWTRRFCSDATTDPNGKPIAELLDWTKRHWKDVVLKPASGYSGHGIFVGKNNMDNRDECIQTALDKGNYIIQELVPLALWSEKSTWPLAEEQGLALHEWQTDFRCFITDKGLQGFLARFGGVPTNVGSGGGIQPLAVLRDAITPAKAVDQINQALLKLGYRAFIQIQEEIDRQAVEMGFTYLLGPIKILLRPRILTADHLKDLRHYAQNLWQDAVKLEALWRQGQLDDVVYITQEEKDLALTQPWNGRPALMVSDGLFSFGADLIDAP
jgi:hypothetical protein